METPKNNQKTLANGLVITIGLLLIAIGVFMDPVGSSPDTGVIDLGSMGSKWLLGILGSIVVLVGSRKLIH